MSVTAADTEERTLTFNHVTTGQTRSPEANEANSYSSIIILGLLAFFQT